MHMPLSNISSLGTRIHSSGDPTLQRRAGLGASCYEEHWRSPGSGLFAAIPVWCGVMMFTHCSAKLQGALSGRTGGIVSREDAWSIS